MEGKFGIASFRSRWIEVAQSDDAYVSAGAEVGNPGCSDAAAAGDEDSQWCVHDTRVYRYGFCILALAVGIICDIVRSWI